MADDERAEELETIVAIYPELQIDEKDQFRFFLDIAVSPINPATISYPGSSGTDLDDENDRASAILHHLPPIKVDMTLPEGYPESNPPTVKLSDPSAWIPASKLKELEELATALWEDYGHSMIIFTYLDSLQQGAETAFDVPTTPTWALPTHDLGITLIAFNASSAQRIFDGETHDCGICLEPKPGRLSHRFNGCGHVFCRACLKDFYGDAITKGEVANVLCPDSTCGLRKIGPKRTRRTKRTIDPAELLAIGLDREAVQRYVDLKRKRKLEADKNMVYCPREWCQAPIKSAKYPPQPILEDISYASDTGDEGEAEPLAEAPVQPAPVPAEPATTTTAKEPPKPNKAPDDRLAICSKCQLAFCRVCKASWHGEYLYCLPRSAAELSAEDKASYDFVLLHTSPCPTCSVPAQKTYGCNHMICPQCETHFCYLCSMWLDPGDPYKHFSREDLPCQGHLWDAEDGNEEGAQFNGPRAFEAMAMAIAEAEAELDAQVGPGVES
ncbi:RWD-domain-containing protein [Trichodelitschia bisporula]|uniref:RBR-type E3 ubiquitin transferase n=1 Tax=Trichodelitschia bisporula TaxID=703511 RepID=A0A6G1HMS6_9PEZI|nr:RWD-domain-containing protein [Trichodelitschia bisporula]